MANTLKLLCVDTSTFHESVALMDGDTVIGSTHVERRGGHGPGILDDIANLLSEAGWQLSDLDGFACGLGPGSFTGLRIGLATMKAFAVAMNKPIFGARTTTMLLSECDSPLKVAVIDARREQVYLDAAHLDAPVCCDPKDIHRYIALDTPWTFLGDGAVKYRAFLSTTYPTSSISEDENAHRPQARTLARLVDVDRPGSITTLEPIYIRKSDAEINYPDGFPDAMNHRTKGNRKP